MEAHSGTDSPAATKTTPSHQAAFDRCLQSSATRDANTSATAKLPKFGSGTELHEALLVSVEEGTTEAVLRIISKGVDVNAKGGQYGHALCAAACHGRKEIVKVLIDQGALVNAPASSKDGYSLHAAAAEGHLDVVKVLLNKGAQVQLQGGQFRFPLTAGESKSYM